jgi:aspartate/methionine/tyrosine aminotransferase
MSAGSRRATRLPQSIFSEISRLADAHGAINLSQGFPDLPAPDAVKEAAAAAIRADLNQYAETAGVPALRAAIAADFTRRHGVAVDPDTDVTVCCGSTEAMLAAILGLVDEGDEVVIFEPFYENYGPAAMFAGAMPRYVTLGEPGWTFDRQALEEAFNARTRAVIINTPNNPTGKVFTRQELEIVAGLCRRWNVLAVTDEIYEHLVYDGRGHVPIASLDGMADRTVTIGSLSKTFSVTGWRVGWAIAAAELSAPIRKVHDYLTVAAPTPFQEAAVAAFALPDDYFVSLAADYTRRRDLLVDSLRRHGFACETPEGAYYVMADIGAFDAADDWTFARFLIEEIGVAGVPGSSFYVPAGPATSLRPGPSTPLRSGPSTPLRPGSTKLRFCFCKQDETLREADRRLARLAATSHTPRPVRHAR